jgi:DNA-3-methyladenine glycosylase II
MVRPKFTPPNVLKLKPSQLRACGLSNAKVTAIRTLSKAALDGTVDLVKIHLNDDSRVVQILTSLKGIGPWTAEMILMFSLGRRDVFSKGDLGLRKGIMRLYGLKDLPSDRTMDDLSRKWSPYRTYAARILWRTVDVKPPKD